MEHGGSPSFLSGGGEMGALIRAYDWSQSELGAPNAWPQSLKTAVGILLNSGYPMYIGWGPNFIQIYNDAYRPILGETKHPAALGASTKHTFSEIWDFIGPMFRSVIEHAKTSTFTDQHLPLNRFGFAEECYFVFSYSPVLLQSGEAGGVFVTVLETTDRVLRERRQLVQKNIAATPSQSGRGSLFRSAITSIASCREDVPFAAICSLDDHGRWVIAASEGTEGLADDVLISLLDKIGDNGPSPDPFDLQDDIVCAPWPEPVTRVAFRPIAPPGSPAPAGMIVFGLSPRLRWDTEYSGFLDMCALTLSSVLADAEAFEMERERAEALGEIDRAKTAFFSNVSHEFRTPLTLMIGPLEETLADTELDAAARSRLETVHRNSLRLHKLVNSLLDFSRIEAGRMQAYYQPTELGEFTSDLASCFRSAIEKAGMTLVVQANPLPSPVYVDRDMWENIVLNLMSNAFKFTLEGRISVEIGPGAGGHCAEVIVRDTGLGIPKNELPRLFERFHRIEGVSGRSIEGSGIGLALVQELVKLHGAQIFVESEPGRGSAFTISVPYGFDHLPPERIAKEEKPAVVGRRSMGFLAEALRWLPGPDSEFPGLSESDELPASDTAPGTDRHLLVVDDNADMREYIRHLLQADGYQVETAQDGLSALRAIERRQPDLVLSDVMMAGLGGFGLLQKIRGAKSTRDLPFIMLSARAGEEAKIDGLGAGADDYIVKPFSARELLARVASAIKLADARRQVTEVLRKENTRLHSLFEQAPGFMATTRGPDHIFEFANAAYSRLVGDRKLLGVSVKDAFPEIAGQGFIEALDRVYASGERFVGENIPLRLRKSPDGPPRDLVVDFLYEPILDANGKVTGIFVQGHDVTMQSRQQQHLRLLVNELNHRVKNTLAIVQAISQQTFKTDAVTSRARNAFAGRLAALAAAHDLLTRQSWESTDLKSVADEVLKVQNGSLPRVSITGPPVRLEPKAAVTIAMALHELCTNAVKYGALSVEQGQAWLSWSLDADDGGRLRIVWREAGGPEVIVPARRGFGTRMLERALASELRGQVSLDFRPDGLVCQIDAPSPQGGDI